MLAWALAWKVDEGDKVVVSKSVANIENCEVIKDEVINGAGEAIREVV